MASEQVKTVLINTRRFHSRASALFNSLSEQCDQPRAKMLLDYLSDHERRLADAIAETELAAPEKVLGTWVQSSELSSHLEKCHELNEGQVDSSFEELVELALKIDEAAIEVYEDLAQRGEPEWLQDMFRDLLTMEREEEKQLATQTLRGMDL